MTARWLHEALEAGGLSLSDTYPRDLLSMVPFHLPVAFISIDELATTNLEKWLAHRRIAYRSDGRRRRLRPTLVARAGRGVIFIDSTDSVEEQRFTAARGSRTSSRTTSLPRQRRSRLSARAFS